MQSTFGVIMLALVPDVNTRQLVPKVLTLRQCLGHYIEHRHEVIVRRTQFDLDKALEREHILEGLKIAVDNIDEVIRMIRAADDTPTAVILAAGSSDVVFNYTTPGSMFGVDIVIDHGASTPTSTAD